MTRSAGRSRSRSKKCALSRRCAICFPGSRQISTRSTTSSEGDAWPYGIEPNRPTLEALVADMAEQSLIARPVALEDIFVPIFGRH